MRGIAVLFAIEPDLTTSTLIGAGRVVLIVEYKGTAYHGWQIQQPGVPSIEACVQHAVSLVADETVNLTCAGRTDAGVHASHQVVHFDTRVVRSARAWILGVNARLPDDIRILWAGTAQPEFDARFSALYRRYRYIMYSHPIPPGLIRDQVTWVRHPLCAERMHDAAQALLGERDFSAFRASGCQSRTPWRNVHRAQVYTQGPFVVLDIQANAFLHHMVRNITGSLLRVGSGEAPQDWIAELMDARDRRLAAPTAPANGLYLVDVGYPEHFGMPKAPPGPLWLGRSEMSTPA